LRRRSGTPACCSPRPARRIAGRACYWSWLRVVLVVVAVAHRSLGPSSGATTSRPIGRCRPRRSKPAAEVGPRRRPGFPCSGTGRHARPGHARRSVEERRLLGSPEPLNARSVRTAASSETLVNDLERETWRCAVSGPRDLEPPHDRVRC
jgi:hypothetical protein